MACVGHKPAHMPQCVQTAASVTGAGGTVAPASMSCLIWARKAAMPRVASVSARLSGRSTGASGGRAATRAPTAGPPPDQWRQAVRPLREISGYCMNAPPQKHPPPPRGSHAPSGNRLTRPKRRQTRGFHTLRGPQPSPRHHATLPSAPTQPAPHGHRTRERTPPARGHARRAEGHPVRRHCGHTSDQPSHTAAPCLGPPAPLRARKPVWEKNR